MFLVFGSDEEELNVFALFVTRIAIPNYSQLEAIICTGRKRHLGGQASEYGNKIC